MTKWNIKNIIKEFIIGILIIFILTNIISYVRKPELRSNQLPHIEVKLLDGSDYRVDLSKPLILHFWGTWCPTCKLEIDNIEYLSKKFEVLTIAVNSGDKMLLQKYLDNKSLTFRVVNDNHGEWAKKFNVEAYPTTFIYDSNGELRFTEVGYTTTAGLLARMAMIKE
ncbi:MAG: redoxin domain-containing protein [Sulfurovum sp.]|nr:redoxin domain-containing protein [Sulfurovum sp.]